MKHLTKKDIDNLLLFQNRFNIPIMGVVAGGKPIEHLMVYEGYRTIRPVPGVKPEDIACLQLVGNSLSADGILEGDWIIYKFAYEAKPGQLVVANTPDALTVKYYHPWNDALLLRGAESKYDQFWEDGEITLEGIVVRVERDYE